ncbi:MAG: hypothetical protein WC915_06260 [archaeon]|jgi:hypothetical protein
MINNNKEFLVDLSCEELCVISNKKDSLNEKRIGEFKRIINKELKIKMCPIC